MKIPKWMHSRLFATLPSALSNKAEKKKSKTIFGWLKKDLYFCRYNKRCQPNARYIKTKPDSLTCVRGYRDSTLQR